MNNSRKHKLFFLFVIINVLFPKAGVKFAGIPITLGSVLLLFLIVKEFGILINKKKLSLGLYRKLVLLDVIYWIIRMLVGFILKYNTTFAGTVGSDISYFVSYVIYTLAFFISLHEISNHEQMVEISEVISSCIFITMLYALLQYICGIGITAIPGITVNLSDYLEAPNSWWLEKYNSFGSNSSKIMSTYQNGNIYGANLILLFPLSYLSLQYKKKYLLSYIFLGLFYLCIYLTGSRSMCIGMLFYILVLLLQTISKQLKKRTVIFGGCTTIVGGYAIYKIFSSKSELVQRMLSALNKNVLLSATGRTEQLVIYFQWLFSNLHIGYILGGAYGFNYEGGSYEVLIGTIFIMGGMVGVIVFFTPYIIIMFKLFKQKDWISRGISTGLLIYLITSLVEGAFWLPPTAMNVWMLLGLGTWLLEHSNKFLDKNLSSNLIQ